MAQTLALLPAATRSESDPEAERVATRSAPPERLWRTLAPVVIFHLVTRAVVIGGLLVAAALSRKWAFSGVVTRWDGQWYYRVAVLGYPSPLPTHPDGRVQSSTAAFFPLYSFLVNGLRSIGLPYWQAGMLLNLVASTVAVLIIVLVGQEYLDRRAAQLLGCLWTAFPFSAVLTATYTEAVFAACGAAALLFTLRRKWLIAGLLAALAGAVRSPGVIFAGALGLAALEAIIRRREWRSLIGVAIAPLGFLASIGYIGWKTGTPDAWHATERDGWQTTVDYGSNWLGYLFQPKPDLDGRLHLLLALFGVGSVALVIIAIALRPPLPIIGLLAVGTFVAFGFGGVVTNAAPRVLMSFFPFLAPLAVLMARWRPLLRWSFLGLSAVVAAVIGGYYFAFAPLPI